MHGRGHLLSAGHLPDAGRQRRECGDGVRRRRAVEQYAGGGQGRRAPRRGGASPIRNCCRCLLLCSKRVDSPQPPKPRTCWDGAKTLKTPLKFSAEVWPQEPETADAAPAAVEGNALARTPATTSKLIVSKQ
mmetsp:Transcript_25387/g.51292  ORF Transcript_25387/g.51292 Transcript_25387/m.51292 type:complete len:132 (+) Transcript_25387:49-444(+)